MVFAIRCEPFVLPQLPSGLAAAPVISIMIFRAQNTHQPPVSRISPVNPVEALFYSTHTPCTAYCSRGATSREPECAEVMFMFATVFICHRRVFFAVNDDIAAFYYHTSRHCRWVATGNSHSFVHARRRLSWLLRFDFQLLLVTFFPSPIVLVGVVCSNLSPLLAVGDDADSLSIKMDYTITHGSHPTLHQVNLATVGCHSNG